MEAIALLVAASLNTGTVLALAALGLLLNERAGVVNLGAEGMMLVGAIAGFAAAASSGSDLFAFAAGAVAGALLAALFGTLVVGLGANATASGLAIALFGTGLAALAGVGYTQQRLPARDGAVELFGLHPMVYAAIALTVALAWFLYRSRGGLVLRAVGESAQSAHALGLPVARVRFGAVLAGGALCGLAGAYLSVIYALLWSEGITAGRGWIALALVAFASRRPERVLLGAYLFGAITMLQFHLQAAGVQVASPWLLSMLPYLATIVVLAAISRDARLAPAPARGRGSG